MCDGGWREENMDLHEEIRELEAEIERLRADADRLTAEVAVQVRRAIKAESERDGDLLAENERLRKRVLELEEDRLEFLAEHDPFNPLLEDSDE